MSKKFQYTEKAQEGAKTELISILTQTKSQQAYKDLALTPTQINNLAENIKNEIFQANNFTRPITPRDLRRAVGNKLKLLRIENVAEDVITDVKFERNNNTLPKNVKEKLQKELNDEKLNEIKDKLVKNIASHSITAKDSKKYIEKVVKRNMHEELKEKVSKEIKELEINKDLEINVLKKAKNVEKKEPLLTKEQIQAKHHYLKLLREYYNTELHQDCKKYYNTELHQDCKKIITEAIKAKSPQELINKSKELEKWYEDKIQQQTKKLLPSEQKFWAKVKNLIVKIITLNLKKTEMNIEFDDNSSKYTETKNTTLYKKLNEVQKIKNTLLDSSKKRQKQYSNNQSKNIKLDQLLGNNPLTKGNKGTKRNKGIER